MFPLPHYASSALLLSVLLVHCPCSSGNSTSHAPTKPFTGTLLGVGFAGGVDYGREEIRTVPMTEAQGLLLHRQIIEKSLSMLVAAIGNRRWALWQNCGVWWDIKSCA